MNAYFGDKRIALEPIPNDATAVVVRVDTWEKMESALATLRAEAVRLQKLLDAKGQLLVAYRTGNQQLADKALTVIEDLPQDTPATQREVERVRAMERVVEIVGRILPMTSWWVGPEVDELRAAYEQVVKP